VITESNAEKAIEELKAYQADLATVLRGKRLRVIPAAELVPGDVVEVTVGAKVPCDCRLISIFSSQLRCDQSILTGESDSMQKDLAPCQLRGVSSQFSRMGCRRNG
jgi:Ca2+ transporting ATPase